MQICEPVVNNQFHRMIWLERVAESFRYISLSFEHWISPDGKMREWVKSNARLAAFLAAPTLMALPVATIGLWELLACVNALTTIATKLVFLPILALLAVFSISFACRLLRR